jgi:lipoic acid synthetase
VLTVAEKTKNSLLHILDCGLADYRDVLQQQLQLCEEKQQGRIPDTILITEHPPVITLGARQSANKLRTNSKSLKEQGIDVVDVRRGGGTTAHNPGQLVFYPILNLRELNLGINEYIRTLEGIGIELLEQLNVKAQRRKGFPGLWVKNRKIASIGVRVSKSVTYHGMAINIQNNLSIFDYIVPCGLDEVEITSVLNETEITYSMDEVKNRLSQILKSHLSRRRLPEWLKRPLPASDKYLSTETVLNSLGIETICHNANCPNRGRCWSRGTATILILGNICTRNCKFCSVTCGKPDPPDLTEPGRIAEMARQMDTKYLVITSVNRDDLPNGGAGHFRDCIRAVRRQCPDIKIEILTPDFRNCQNEAIEILATEILSHRDHREFVFAHNVETVPSLYSKVRSGGDYQRSLNLLKIAKESYDGVPTKSSIMLGLGETDAEVEQTLKDLRNIGCDRITIGQYLKPSKNSLEVIEYIPPAKFNWWRQRAIELGFKWVISEPFARSSYFAEMTTTV